MKRAIVAALLLTRLAWAADATAISRAFGDGAGHLLLETRVDSQKDRAYFFGDEAALRQLEPSWESESGTMRRVAFQDGEIEMDERGARLVCGSSERRLAILDQPALARLNERLHARRLVLALLPHVMEPRFLYHVDGTGEYVLIKTPYFATQNEYEVWMGFPGRLRLVPTRLPKKIGVIPFTSRGGIFLPVEIDLLRPSSVRGVPILRLPTGTRKLLPLARIPGWARGLMKRPPIIRRVGNPCNLLPQSS